MKRVLNFTDRDDHISKSGLNAEIQIHVQDKNSNTIYTPEINIKKDYPKNSKIYIQPYSTEGYVGTPVYFGTIENPDNKSVEDADASPDQIRFNLKVVEDTDNPIKKVLGTCYAIKPWQPANSSMLEIGEQNIDSIYQIEVIENEKPKIIFKQGLGFKADIQRSNWLKGIIFTAALREILLKYIIESEEFKECKIKRQYVEFFKTILKEPFPEKYISGDDANGTRKWLNLALSEFSNNNFKKGISLISIMPDSDIEIEAKALFTGDKS